MGDLKPCRVYLSRHLTLTYNRIRWIPVTNGIDSERVHMLDHVCDEGKHFAACKQLRYDFVIIKFYESYIIFVI